MSKHRLDALSDGIFAVAMTLLVIELKIPTGLELHDNAALVQALATLWPRLISWVISFMVLAFFWWGHHRAFHFVRHIDGRVAFLNLLFLAVVSFMPFASALSGEYTSFFAAQVVYSLTMLVNAVLALFLWRYIHRHPELCEVPMSAPAYRAARMRVGMLAVISAVAVLISWVVPGAGNAAFMLMAAAGPLSRRIEAGVAPLAANDPTA